MNANHGGSDVYEVEVSMLHTVGLKRPNAWGLYDTHGNVWELCLDKYNGVDGKNVVVRGGSWSAQAFHCCPEYRVMVFVTDAGNNLGFRVERSLP